MQITKDNHQRVTSVHKVNEILLVSEVAGVRHPLWALTESGATLCISS